MSTILDDVGDCGLHKRTPYGIRYVRQTQFSIARHCGGIKFNGDSYTYFPDEDELIRDDVLRWKVKQGWRHEKQPAIDAPPGAYDGAVSVPGDQPHQHGSRHVKAP